VQLVQTGALAADTAQEAAVGRLSLLLRDVDAYRHAVAQHQRDSEAYTRDVELARREVERRAKEAREELTRPQLEARVLAEVGPPPLAPLVPRGVFLHGGVGTGKTLLMDLAATTARRQFGDTVVKRVHLNAASLEIHSIMHKLQQGRGAASVNGSDVEPTDDGSWTWKRMAHAARAALLASRRRRTQQAQQQMAAASTPGPSSNAQLLSNAAIWREVALKLMGPSVVHAKYGLLCFDEFAVTDAFTAAALKGVFEECFEMGVAVVATANRTPEHMRDEPRHSAAALFDSFAARLQDRYDTWRLDGGMDYRMTALEAARQAEEHLLLTPLDASTRRRMDAIHRAVCLAEQPGGTLTPCYVPIAFGRILSVGSACGGVARFHFADLCDTPRGAADFHALANAFHTVVVDGVPLLPAGAADIARRFITLVDELYNAKVALVLSAEVTPEQLFAGAGAGGDNAPLVDLESLQSETASEDARSRRDVTRSAGVGAIKMNQGASAADIARAVAAVTGADERFAFARAVSRLAEMRTPTWVQHSKAPVDVQKALLDSAI